MSGGLIIFGRQTKQDYGPTSQLTCRNCNNRTYYDLVYVKTSVELWAIIFIKIIAYKKRYYLLCPICSRGVELKGQQIDAAKKLNEATSAYLKNSLPAEQYEAVLNEVRGELEIALDNFPK